MIVDLCILLFLSCIPFIWLSSGHILAGYDSGFRFTGLTHIINLLQNWNFIQNYGTNWSIYRAFTVLQFPEAILTTITGSLHTAELITFIGWFFVMASTMYFLIRRIFQEQKYRFFRLYGGVLYAVNFFVLNGWLNAERAKFSLYAALPLAIALLWEEAFGKRKTILHALLFGFLYAVWNGGGSPPLYGATVVALGIVGLSFIVVRWKRDGMMSAFRLCGAYLLYLISFLVWNSYWILPLVAVTNTSYGTAVASQGGIGGLIEWEKVFSQNASFTNLFRLQGFPDWYNNPAHPYANAFIQQWILVVGSFMPMMIVLFGVWKFGFTDMKRKPVLIALFILLAIGLVFAAGSHPPTGLVYVLLMKYLPGFAVFRSSFYKFAPAVWFSVILLSGYYLSVIIDAFGKRSAWKTSVWVCVIVGILAYHFPYYQNTSFDIPNGFTTRVQVPDYVNEMKADIERQTTVEDRILLMPDLDSGFITLPMDAYTWGFYSADILPRMLTNRSFVAGDANDDGITRRMYQDIYSGNSEEFYRLAAMAGVTHILWRGDIRQSDVASKVLPLDRQKTMLQRVSEIDLVAQDGPWTLYKLNTAVRPMIYQTERPITVTGVVVGDASVVGDATVVRANAPVQIGGMQMIGLECVMCNTREFEKFEAGIYLPAPDHSILSKIKTIIRQKKPVIQNTPTKQIDETLSTFLQTLSSIVYGSGSSSIDQVTVQIKELSAVFEQLSGRDRILYANRLYAYMMAAIRLTKNTPVTTEIKTTVEPFMDELSHVLFVSDQKTARYIVNIPSAGTYTLLSPDAVQATVVDHEQTISLRQQIYLTEGLHTVELQRIIESDTPVLFFEIGTSFGAEITPVTYRRNTADRYSGSIKSDQSTFVVFNQRFDPRWYLVLMNGGKPIMVTDHWEANGYANAWKLPDRYTGQFEIRYR